ncbi:MAG TPA: formate dehydrogenase accessory sulfurtransferase FdhD [Nevskiaceae bacterium]|nr:formate dehydrogenase accessory sulfurtransferase FdhD [Nevskiaceae bacterium]
MTEGSVHRAARRLTVAGGEALDEIVAEEVAVALVYNGISHAVMMATPCDLEDFARGFSLTERIVEKPSEIYDIEVEPVDRGIEVRLDIAAQRMVRLQERRRSLAGRTGCGLCGVDSIDAAMRPVTVVGATSPVSRQAIERAMAALPLEQRINRVNGATHAAGWSRPDGTLVAVREDVGRHNALDKLIGHLLTTKADLARGFLVITSRASYEMVLKAAVAGMPIVVAISAPTAYAVRIAEEAGITLVGFARRDRHTVYACPGRIVRGEGAA